MPIHDISTESGFLIGLSVSLVFYGVYCTLFTLTLYTIKICESNSNLVTGAIVVLFILCSVIMALHIAACYDGFIQWPSVNRTPGYFVDPFQPHQDWFPVREVLVFVSNLITEFLLIWRLYMVWSKSWKVLIFPAIAMTVLISGGITSVVLDFIVYLSPTQKAKKFIPILKLFIPIGWIPILANNLFCTALIVWKLWWMAKTAEGRTTAKLANLAVSALVESGALYTSTMLCIAILSAAGISGIRRVLVMLLTVVIGIASTSIVFRLNLIAAQKPSRSIQNDVSVVQPAPSGAIIGNFGPNESRSINSEVEIEVIPGPLVFAQRSPSGFNSSTSGDGSD